LDSAPRTSSTRSGDPGRSPLRPRSPRASSPSRPGLRPAVWQSLPHLVPGWSADSWTRTPPALATAWHRSEHPLHAPPPPGNLPQGVSLSSDDYGSSVERTRNAMRELAARAPRLVERRILGTLPLASSTPARYGTDRDG
jgi:hypothetical protein